jgi:hypothetical protein
MSEQDKLQAWIKRIVESNQPSFVTNYKSKTTRDNNAMDIHRNIIHLEADLQV